MIQYPGNLPCPNTYNFKAPETFLRSNFDFAVRTRPTTCKTSQVEYSFIFNDNAQYELFRTWYYVTLLGGSQPFEADFLVEGNAGLKVFRFANFYSSTVQDGLFRLNATFDVITKFKDFI